MTIKQGLIAVTCLFLLTIPIFLFTFSEPIPEMDSLDKVSVMSNGNCVIVVLQGEGKELGLFYSQEGLEFYVWKVNGKLFLRENGKTVCTTEGYLYERIGTFLKKHTPPPTPTPDRRHRA